MDKRALLQALRAPVQERPTATYSPGPRQRAAVLCPIYDRGGALSVLLTRRSAHLKAHAGQISFPGGKIDAEDASPLHAALREAEEEIGLRNCDVDVVGSLRAYDTSTGFLVLPFVGIVDALFMPRPAPDEVAAVFEVPFAFLADLRNYRPMDVVRHGKPRRYYEILYREHRIWGATAGMLHDLAERLAGAGSAGVCMNPQAPVWAS